MKEGKAFRISQMEVLNAYKAVKANKGAGGVDGVEIEEFDRDWKNRLYVLWNMDCQHLFRHILFGLLGATFHWCLIV